MSLFSASKRCLAQFKPDCSALYERERKRPMTEQISWFFPGKWSMASRATKKASGVDWWAAPAFYVSTNTWRATPFEQTPRIITHHSSPVLVVVVCSEISLFSDRHGSVLFVEPANSKVSSFIFHHVSGKWVRQIWSQNFAKFGNKGLFRFEILHISIVGIRKAGPLNKESVKRKEGRESLHSVVPAWPISGGHAVMIALNT